MVGRIIQHVWEMVANGTRPIDWISLTVEFAVLGVIILFERGKWWHEIKARKEARKLASLLAEGESIKASAANLLHNSQGRDQLTWADSAQTWAEAVQRALATDSPRALSAFNHITSLQATDRAVITGFGQLHHVSGLFGDAYQVLQARLSNLQTIIGDPERYF